MTKEKKILINYILYFITFFVICIIGASNVFAVSINSTDYATKYYWYTADNINSTTSTDYRTGSDNKVTLYGATAPTYTNGEGFNGFYNRINYTISKGSIYTLSLAVSYSSLQDSEFGYNSVNSRLLTTDFAHCSNCTITAVSGSIRKYSSTNQSISGLYDYVVQMSYTFVSTSNANTWYIGSYTGDDRTLGIDNHLYTSNVMVNNLEISNDNSSTIINQNDTIINQNQQMIDQNQQNTEDIIDNNNTNTQDIINNNDTNTNKIIEENKKNFNDCRDSVNLFDKNDIINGKGFIDTGEIVDNNLLFITNNYIQVLPNTKYVFSNDSAIGRLVIVEYTNEKQFIKRNIILNQNILTITTTEQTKFVRLNSVNTVLDTLQFEKGSVRTTYEPFGEICTNKLDEQNKTSKGILAKLGDLFNTLFSNEDADVSGLDNMVGWLPPGPVDSIINLPLSLFNSLTNTLSGTCSPVTLTLPFVNQNLTLPCFDTYMTQYVSGFNTLWTLIGFISSIFILYYYLLALYKWVDDTLTMRENNLPGYYDDNWGGGA